MTDWPRRVGETIDVLAGHTYAEPDIRPKTLSLNGIDGHHINIYNDQGVVSIVTTTFIDHMGERVEVRSHFDLDDEAAEAIIAFLKEKK